MVNLVQDRTDRLLDVAEVSDPAAWLVELAGQFDHEPVGVPMDIRTIMPRRHVLQPVGRIKRELAKDLQPELPFGQRGQNSPEAYPWR